MAGPTEDMLHAFDGHDVEGVRGALAAGADPCTIMGLMPQMHRNEHNIYSNIRKLLDASGRTGTPLRNVPNRYLQPKSIVP